MTHFITNNRGLTVTEIMVVLVVLAIGVIPMALVQTAGNRDVVRSGQRTEALQVAQEQMELTRSMGFNNAVADTGVTGPYNWATAIQPSGPLMNEVMVVVTWQEGADPRQVRLTSLLSSR